MSMSMSKPATDGGNSRCHFWRVVLYTGILRSLFCEIVNVKNDVLMQLAWPTSATLSSRRSARNMNVSVSLSVSPPCPPDAKDYKEQALIRVQGHEEFANRITFQHCYDNVAKEDRRRPHVLTCGMRSSSSVGTSSLLLHIKSTLSLALGNKNIDSMRKSKYSKYDSRRAFDNCAEKV